jgi:thiamine-phosphate pyrophosphorylase
MSPTEITRKLQTTRLYAILDTGYSDPSHWSDLSRQLIAGGVGAIQIRAKQSSTAEIQNWALTIQPVLRAAGVPLIINDYPEIAESIGAEACHIGQDDLSVVEARERSGGKIIGKSTHSLAQAEAAQEEGADYIGFGPIFPTLTKPDYQAIGIDDIAEMARRIHIPHFCIGGIKREHVSGLKTRGAERVVIVSGLLQSPDPEIYARDVIHQLMEAAP